MADRAHDAQAPAARDPGARALERRPTAVFGSTIPTAILMSIGVLGWTFEALCCAVATGKYRENVKSVIPPLEEDGIFEASRPRPPGPDVRVLTFADSFPAKAELEELLRACVAAWPYYANITRSELERISPKTRAHLRKRGLLYVRRAWCEASAADQRDSTRSTADVS